MDTRQADKTGSNGQAVGTLDYLHLLWPDPPAGWLLLWTIKNRRSLWFPSRDLEAVAAAAGRVANHADVWLGCGLSPKDFGRDHRCPAEDIAAIPGLWAD